MERILLVDDDRLQVDVVSFLLRRAGFETTPAFDAASARRLFQEQGPDLVILDVQLGDSDGFELLTEFRERRPEVSILMLTMLAAEHDRVRGLELGADDYLCKPFGHRELVARVRAMLRRRQIRVPAGAPRRAVRVGFVELDPMTHQVTSAGRRVELTPTEFRLLQTLMARPNALVTTRALLKEVWGHDDLTARNVLRVTTSRLRNKLRDASGTSLLWTVPGEGLMIRDDALTAPSATTGRARETSPSSESEAPVDLEVLADLQDLLQAPSGGPTLRQLNEAYGETVLTHISAMRKAIGDGDVAGVAEQAHRLRGSSATLGARRVAKVCAAIEERSRAGDLPAAEDLLADLQREVGLFGTAMAPILRATR